MSSCRFPRGSTPSEPVPTRTRHDAGPAGRAAAVVAAGRVLSRRWRWRWRRGASDLPHNGIGVTWPATTGPTASVAADSSSCTTPATVSVSSASELKKALARRAARAMTIVLAPGIYDGNFTASRAGTSGAPVTLCGPRSAVLDGGSDLAGLHLLPGPRVLVAGRGLHRRGRPERRHGRRGRTTTSCTACSCTAPATRRSTCASSAATTRSATALIRDTGLLVQFYGEGIYVGSAHKNWCRYSGCQPDRSDGDVMKDNNIADTTAENIDIKEGTTGGKIIGNQFDGTGMVESAATGWINVKGNDWTHPGQHRRQQRQERLPGAPGLPRLGDRQRLPWQRCPGERPRLRHLRTEQETANRRGLR